MDSKSYSTESILVIFNGITHYRSSQDYSRLFCDQESILKVNFHMTSTTATQHFREDRSPHMLFIMVQNTAPKENEQKINFELTQP